MTNRSNFRGKGSQDLHFRCLRSINGRVPWRAMWGLLVACLCLWPQWAFAEVRVVATLPDLAALAKEVGGPHVKVQALASDAEDPHFVDARPNYIVALNQADMLVINGADLEGAWLTPLLGNARNAKIQIGGRGYVDASMVVTRMDVPVKVDRAMGDVHPGGNPHFTYDARQAVKIVNLLRDRLTQVDPTHAADYNARAQKVSEELSAFATQQSARFAALDPSKRKVVSYHRSLVYLYDWLSLSGVIEVEPKPGIAPDPGHVARVLSTMKTLGAKVIIIENFQPQKTPDTLAKLVNGRVVVVSMQTRFEKGERYIDHLRQITGSIYDALVAQGG